MQIWGNLHFFRTENCLLLLLSHFSRVQTLCDPIDGGPPGSPVPGIPQARTLEGVAISFSNDWKWKVKVKSLSRLRLLATPWTAAYQAPPSMGFSRREYWSGVPLPSPRKLFPAYDLRSVQLCVVKVQNSEECCLIPLPGGAVHSVMSDSFRPQGQQHARLPCPSLSPGVCSCSHP